MLQTFVEKALARGANLPFTRVGQMIDVVPDRVLSHDNSADIQTSFRELGVGRVYDPDRIVIVLDHAVPAPTTAHARNHLVIRRFVKEQGIRHFFEVGRGICHQVVAEEALILPGELILGADSHSTHHGWLGAFGAGVGRAEVAALWACGALWLQVPESVRIELDAPLPLGVTAKDFALRILRDLGADGGLYCAVEFGGPGIDAMSPAQRMVLANMMAEIGVKNAYVTPNETVFQWLAERAAGRLQLSVSECAAQIRENALFPDSGATYRAVHRYRAAELEPYVAKPHSPDNVAPLSEVAGIPVQQAFLGTCTNGRLEDLAQAARVVRGRRVSPDTRFLVIPASRQVYRAALENGVLADLIDAGAVIGTPGCGPCMGNHLGVPAPDEVTISSANRNYRGRMGTREASIYLAAPAVVAASAITGRITDPADLEPLDGVDVTTGVENEALMGAGV